MNMYVFDVLENNFKGSGEMPWMAKLRMRRKDVQLLDCCSLL